MTLVIMTSEEQMAELEELKQWQYRGGAINNKPAGSQTEKSIFNIAGFSAQDQVMPEQAEEQLAQDRTEIAQVAQKLSERLGEKISPNQARGVLAERMRELIGQAVQANRYMDELSTVQGKQLRALRFGAPVDPQSFGRKASRWFRRTMADNTTTFDLFEGLRTVQIGDKTYDESAKAKTDEQKAVQREAKRISEIWNRLSYGHRDIPPEDIKAMEHFFAEHGVTTAKSMLEFEQGISIDPVLCNRSLLGGRAVGDVVLWLEDENSTDKGEMLRLNAVVLQLADRGIYQKGTSNDPQQRAYPSSPKQFYEQCIATLEQERLQELVDNTITRDEAIWCEHPRNAPGRQSNIQRAATE